jgi:hypothetical protein
MSWSREEPTVDFCRIPPVDASSLRAHTQQSMPVIGYLSPGSLESDGWRVTAFCQGLNESGYVEGKNVAIEYRGAQGQYDRLPGLAADLVPRQVTVMRRDRRASSGTRCQGGDHDHSDRLRRWH